MKKIQLSQGLYAMVDSDVFDRLRQWRWCAAQCSHRKTHAQKRWYAMRSVVEGGKRRTIYLHREVVCAEKGQIVDHIDNDTLDNRRENLRFVTARENQLNQRPKR